MAAVTMERVQDTVRAIAQRTPVVPKVGIILGTGLANLLTHVKTSATIPYPELPHMPRSTAPTHKGQMVFGEIGTTPVVVMEGRFHCYEGYSVSDVAYPVWVMQALGVKTLLISNVAGGLNPAFAIGDLMLATDHVNLMGVSPLVGQNDERLGPRFPDMIAPYDDRLVLLAEGVAKQHTLSVRRGVYAAMLGPQLETKAEYKMLRLLGADAVGMSTVPEVIAAVHAGLRVLTVSIISDLCIPETLKPVNIEEIIAIANKAEPLLTKLFVGVIERL